MRVVLVDDSVIVRKRLARMFLEIPSLTIVGEADNSYEAINIIEAEKPDVVILDISMPGENGIEVLKKIRIINRAVVVIMLTNYPSKQYKVECYKAGVDYFFNKSTEYQLVAYVLDELAKGAFIVCLN